MRGRRGLNGINRSPWTSSLGAEWVKRICGHRISPLSFIRCGDQKKILKFQRYKMRSSVARLIARLRWRPSITFHEGLIMLIAKNDVVVVR